MTGLQLHLLGPFQALLNGIPLTHFRSDKVRALLAYLVMEAGRPHSRTGLATLLWGDSSDQAARASLRQALSNLRRLLGSLAGSEEDGRSLIITSTHVLFTFDHPGVWLDAAVFGTHLAHCQTHPHQEIARCSSCVKLLAEAVELYRGDFLAGITPTESSAFEEWRWLQQGRLQQQAMVALDTLIAYYMAIDDSERVQVSAHRQLEMIPWHEAAHRHLIKALTLDGHRDAALAQYEICCRILAEELGLEPEAETQALVKAIRQGKDLRFPLQSNPHNLPAKATSFVGRERELARLRQWLLDDAIRLVTIFGPGGAGKTRLGLAAARHILQYFAQGVWFVTLAGVVEGQNDMAGNEADPAGPNTLATAIAAALNVNFDCAEAPTTQLQDYLRRKEMLLVLDNFESLLAAATPYVLDLLENAPRLTILITSRERLNCQAEQALMLDGLPVPANQEAGVQVTAYGAVQLFLERVKHAAAVVGQAADDMPAIIKICRLVGGLPLGIELAAAWVGQFSCAEIAHAVRQDLDFLTTSMVDVPERHRSMRAVFDHTWRLLPAREQHILAQIAVFDGSFSREAVQAVTGATLSNITALVDKALIRLVTPGRYSLHPLVRHFAAEKLVTLEQGEAAGLGRQAKERHSHFYLELAAAQEEAFYGRESWRAITTLRTELDNIRQGWRRATAQDQIELIGRSFQGLAAFYLVTGLFQEGVSTLQMAIDRLQHLAGAATAPEALLTGLLADLLAAQAEFFNERGLYDLAIDAAGQAVALAKTQPSRFQSPAIAYLQWGSALTEQGQYEPAGRYLAEALRLARAGQWRRIEIDTLTHLGKLAIKRNQYDEATDLLLQALKLVQEGGKRRSKIVILVNLGIIFSEQRHFGEAQRYDQQALTICREIGDRQTESALLNNLGVIDDYLGDYAAALVHFERSLELAQEIGSRRSEGIALNNLALIAHQQGQNERSHAYSQQALAMHQESGDRLSESYAWTNMGHALAGLEQMDVAAVAYQRAIALRRELDALPLLMEALAGLATLCMAWDDLTQAQDYVAEILAYLDGGGTLNGTEEPFRIYLTCYQVLRAGQDLRTGEFLQTAVRLLRERAAQLKDANLRRQFLERVFAHRTLLDSVTERL